MSWSKVPDRWKFIIVMAAAAALLLAGVGMAAFNERIYRVQKTRDAAVQAQILAASVTAALAFDDARSAQEYVDALSANPEVEEVSVTDAQERTVANYQRPGRPPGAMIVIDTPVNEGGTVLGYVHLRTITEPAARRLIRFGGVALLVAMASMLVAVLGAAQNALSGANRELEARARELQIQMEERANAEEALRQSQKMEAIGQLTGQLLAFSRFQRLELRPLIVADLLQNLRDLLTRTLGPTITLDYEIDTTRVAILADATQLELAVLNLAINARDAMPEGGRLTIATRPRMVDGDLELPAGDYLELSVADTGSGMTPEVIARAFDPFFTTKGVGKGTGLGLSQVYGIARQAGGSVRIESRLGVGTRIILVLRRVEGEVAPQATLATATPTAASGDLKVLVIDDDPDVRQFLCASLDGLGYRVIESADGAQGLVLLDAERPDLLLVDFAMPGMNGAEVAAAARARRPDLPIIVASGYADTDALDAAIIGPARMLHKPFSLAELAQAVQASLAR